MSRLKRIVRAQMILGLTSTKDHTPGVASVYVGSEVLSRRRTYGKRAIEQMTILPDELGGIHIKKCANITLGKIRRIPFPEARSEFTVSFCSRENWKPIIVGIGRAMTAKSDAIFSTARDGATFIRYLVVSDLRGIQGDPVIKHKAKV